MNKLERREGRCKFFSRAAFIAMAFTSISSLAEIAIPVNIEIPAYPQPESTTFPNLPITFNHYAQNVNLGLGSNFSMCGGVVSYEPVPQLMATLTSAKQRYHHIDALLGLNPYTTIHVLRLNSEKKDVHNVVW